MNKDIEILTVTGLKYKTHNYKLRINNYMTHLIKSKISFKKTNTKIFSLNF